MICAYCKNRVFPSDRKCPACGGTVFETTDEPRQRAAAPQEPVAEPQVVYQTIHHTLYVKPERSPRSRWIALFLCLIGGFFGLHRFYAGKMGTGVLYVFTGGLFFFGVFVDFFSILFGYFRDRDGLLLS